MIDTAMGLPNVHPERFALYGISFGGYFVTRAAQYDRRIKALIANSPIVDLHRYMLGFTGGAGSQQTEDFSVSEVDTIPDQFITRTQKLSFKGACRRFGVKTYFEWIDKLRSFTAVDNLGKIVCPSLAMVGAGEGAESMHQFNTFCSTVSGPVTQRIFNVQEGADMHCQVGNPVLSNSIIFDWLSDVFQ